jgi:hypothetical protein
MTPGDATAFIRESMPLCATLGIEALSLAPDEVVLSLAWSEACVPREGCCTVAL